MKFPRHLFRPARILRVLALLFLALPLTGMLEGPPFTSPESILLLDDSPSMRKRFPGFSTEVLRSWDARGPDLPVVVAGEHAMARSAPAPASERFTSLPSALAAAASLFSSRAEKTIFLATDGLSSTEGMRPALNRLREEGIRIFALSPPPSVRQAGVTAAILPSRAYLWEPFPVKARVVSSERGPVTVVLERNGAEIAETVVEIDRTGQGEVQFVQESDRVGGVRYSFTLREFDHPGASGEVLVATAPRVSYIGDDLLTARRLVDIFSGAGIAVRTARPGDLPYDPDIIDGADVIVLDDLPAPALSEEMVRRIARSVATEGKGLLVVGGRRGLGSEDYRDSPLEAILPVTLGYSTPPEPAPVSLVLAMDTSFSMAYQGSGRGAAHGSQPRKIDVAKESAKEVVRVVRRKDRLGIIGNSTDLYWVHETGSVEDREGLLQTIGQLIPRGDGINFYSIVREAHRSLADDPSSIRHILVFGDAEDIDHYEVAGEGHSYDLIREMAMGGVTLSVMAIGQPTDKDVPFLRTATLLGNGDFYLISDLKALPRYFVSEYKKVAARNFIEEPVGLLVGDYSYLLHGIPKPLPGLEGIAAVTARKGTEVPVRTDTGIPLVTLGRHGRGKTAVFASDNGYRWAARFTDWPGATKFWVQLLFAVAPDGGGDTLLSPAFGGMQREGGMAFRYESREAPLPPWDSLWLLPKGREGAPPVELVRRGLTIYRSREPLPGADLYRSTIATGKVDGENLAEASFWVPPAGEIHPESENWELVEELLDTGGGRWIAGLDEISDDGSFLRHRKGVLFILVSIAGMVLLLAESLANYRFWR